jgi:glycosyltransferase involved in cell wall biosynthesis
MPLFSVVIPVYNRASVVEATLKSVLEQSCRDYEIIVVNDGSTDNTATVLNSYKDRVRIFDQKNSGPGAARNRGIKEAKGAYIAFLDSDDVWFPWTLNIFKDVISRYERPSFIVGSFVKFTDSTELVNISRPPLSAKLYKDYYATSKKPLLFGTCSVVVKRELLDAVGGYTDIDMNAEDNDLWLRLGVVPNFVHVTSPPIFAFRQHESIVRNNDKNFLGISHVIKREKSGLYPGSKERKIERLKIETRLFRAFSMGLLKDLEFEKAWIIYCNTFLWNLRLLRLRYLLGFLITLATGRIRNFYIKSGKGKKSD